MLPENFSSAEHLQDTVRIVQNRIVKEEFNDVNGDDDDITTPRASLRVACTHLDADSIEMTNLRLWLFYVCLRKARDFQAPIYGMPVEQFQDEVTFRPQVKLYFSQDYAATPDDKAPLASEITFRLMDETSESITPVLAKSLALKIKQEFATPRFYWDKGKIKCVYKDSKHGYNFSILAQTEAKGEAVARKVVSIRDHLFDLDKFSFSTPRRASENNPVLTERVYGKQRKKRRWRPTAVVRFRWASLQIHNLKKDVVLVDGTGYYPDALEKI